MHRPHRLLCRPHESNPKSQCEASGLLLCASLNLSISQGHVISIVSIVVLCWPHADIHITYYLRLSTSPLSPGGCVKSTIFMHSSSFRAQREISQWLWKRCRRGFLPTIEMTASLFRTFCLLGREVRWLANKTAFSCPKPRHGRRAEFSYFITALYKSW